MALRQTYSVKELSESMAYIAERIRSDDRLGQAFNIRDSSREIRQNMSPIELRAYASRLDGRLGWFHIALEDFYEVKDDGEVRS